MKRLVIFFILFIPVPKLMAQDKQNLYVEFNVNQAQYNMSSLNEYLADTNYYFDPNLYSASDNNKITKGLDYNFAINYQPLKFIDFGINLNYQSSSIWRSVHFVYKPDPINYPDSIQFIVDGKNKIAVNAISAGLSTHLHVNKLLHLEQKESPVLKHLKLSLGVIGLIGSSTLTDRAWNYTPASYERKNYDYSAINIHVRTEINVGYHVGKKFFTDMGFKVGYQLFKTSQLKNYNESYLYLDWDKKKSVNLNFSGIYYGVYLKLGKS